MPSARDRFEYRPDRAALACALLLAVALPASTFAQPTGLDAPVSDQPTVRSEIRRGFDAGAGCKDQQKAFAKLDRCVATLIDRYKTAHPNADAFLAGISVWRWAAADSVVRADGERIPAQALAAVRASATDAYATIVGSARALGVSTHEVFLATAAPPELEARFKPDVLQQSPEDMVRKGDCAEAIIAAERAGGSTLQSILAMCNH